MEHLRSANIECGIRGWLTRYIGSVARLKKRKQKTFTFNDHDKLFLFLYRVSELKSRTYYKKANWKIGTDTFSIDEVDEELFAAFILTFRHFHASDSPTAHGKIQSILFQVAVKMKDTEVQDELRRIRDEFDKSPKFGLSPFDISGNELEPISEEQMFDTYLNCHYFHTDPRGAQQLFQLPELHRTRAHKAFQLSLYRHVRRLVAYVPLVKKYLNSPVLPVGCFSPVAILESGDIAEGTLVFPI